MRYIPHTERDIAQMLDVIGVPDVDSLFSTIPEKSRLRGELDVPAALSEQALLRVLSAMAARRPSTVKPGTTEEAAHTASAPRPTSIATSSPRR